MSDTIRQEPVTFYSDGIRIAGDLFFPTGGATSDKPAVVVGHGFGGIKKFFLGDIARALASHGHLALTFDYRGFGDSDGARNRMVPLEQVQDMLAAVEYLASRPETPDLKISIYGTSFGGGIAVAAGCSSDLVGSVVCGVGIANYGRWLKSLRRYWEWVEFEKRLAVDRCQRVLTGVSELVEPEEIMVRDPESTKHEAHLRATYPDRAFKLELASADAIIDFVPTTYLAGDRVPALFFVGVEGDTLTPYEETLDFYAQSPEPKELLTLSGMTHHDMYKPQNLSGVIERVSKFLSAHALK